MPDWLTTIGAKPCQGGHCGEEDELRRRGMKAEANYRKEPQPRLEKAQRHRYPQRWKEGGFVLFYLGAGYGIDD